MCIYACMQLIWPCSLNRSARHTSQYSAPSMNRQKLPQASRQVLRLEILDVEHPSSFKQQVRILGTSADRLLFYASFQSRVLSKDLLFLSETPNAFCVYKATYIYVHAYSIQYTCVYVHRAAEAVIVEVRQGSCYYIRAMPKERTNERSTRMQLAASPSPFLYSPVTNWEKLPLSFFLSLSLTSVQGKETRTEREAGGY